MLGGIGVQELILIVLVVLILFGAKRIPDIAQGLGRGIRDFRKAMKDTTDEINRVGKDDEEDSKKNSSTKS
jgi:sec-independent protein translocase protein TatA